METADGSVLKYAGYLNLSIFLDITSAWDLGVRHGHACVPRLHDPQARLAGAPGDPRHQALRPSMNWRLRRVVSPCLTYARITRCADGLRHSDVDVT